MEEVFWTVPAYGNPRNLIDSSKWKTSPSRANYPITDGADEISDKGSHFG